MVDIPLQEQGEGSTDGDDDGVGQSMVVVGVLQIIGVID